MFQLTMNLNAVACITPFFYLNSLTKMWHHWTTFQILSSSFLKYVKLAKLAMVHIVYNVKNERYFFTLVL
jgi:hypothetical protein